MTAANTATGEKHLELTVSNFGPIAEGTVELRPFTVFVGPSNTGKSYLATLIYALHEFLGKFSERTEYGHDSSRVTTSGWPLADSARQMELSTEEAKAVYTWAYEEIALGRANRRLDREYVDVPPDIIADLVRRVISSGSGESRYWNGAVLRCFGVGKTDHLSRHQGRKGNEFSVSGKFRYSSEDSEYFRFQTSVTSSGTMIDFSIPNTLPVQMDFGGIFPWLYFSLDDVAQLNEDNVRLFLGTLASPVLSYAVGNVGRSAYYLPADRAGAVRSHQALTSALISRASSVLSDRGERPTFSGVYGDFLERLVGLGNSPSKPAASVEHLSEKMERNILDGEIRIDTNPVGYPSFFYRPKKWDTDLPLMNASSMVSELAPVVLYLRHVIQPGETLIIEEPELALHPAMQVEFTRLLAAAVKAGIRIIITTHSEWVLEELANLVLMSELPVEQRQGFEGADLALSPDEVGAWLFEPDAEIGGTVVKEMPLDKEMGNFDSGFGLITTDLYNRYARISNRIERLKEG